MHGIYNIKFKFECHASTVSADTRPDIDEQRTFIQGQQPVLPVV